MSWIPILIAFLFGVASGAVGMFVFGPRRAAPGSSRRLEGPASAGLLPFSSSPTPEAGATPTAERAAPASIVRRSGGVFEGMPEGGEFDSPALEALIAHLEESGVTNFECEYDGSEFDHLKAYRGSWSGELDLDGARRSASFSLTVYKSDPDEIWVSGMVQHGLDVGAIPYLRADQREAGAGEWALQRADEVATAFSLAVLNSPAFEGACGLVAEAHDPASPDSTLWALALTSDALCPIYRFRGVGHSPFELFGALHSVIRGQPYTTPTRAELELWLSDPHTAPSLAREIARHLIGTASTPPARDQASQLALAHPSSDVRLTAAVDMVGRGGADDLGFVSELLTEVQEEAPGDAISGQLVETMLDALEGAYAQDEEAPYVGALLGALTYRTPLRLRAVEIARPLVAPEAPRRDAPGVVTFAERILGELTPREDLEVYIGWMRVAGSAYYTGTAFARAAELGGLDAAELGRVLAVAHAHAEGDFYLNDLFGKVRRVATPPAGWRAQVWRVFGLEWVDEKVVWMLSKGDDATAREALELAVELGGPRSIEQLRELSEGRGPLRAEAEEAYARATDRAVSGGLSVADGGVVGGLTDASTAGGLSDA